MGFVNGNLAREAGRLHRWRERLWGRGNITKRKVYFGVGVSLKIEAHQAKDDFLEIRGVVIDFQIP